MYMDIESGSKVPRRKWKGANCCIIGCHATQARCRGLSFISIPKAGESEDQDKWRASLIQAINRYDKNFNPNKAKICSRHFMEGCVKYGPTGKCSGLVPWSLPTRWMPGQPHETPEYNLLCKSMVTELNQNKNQDSKLTMTWKEGYRIVDLCELARQMNCKICNSLLDLKQTQAEIRTGLASILYIACQCGVINHIRTSKRQQDDTGRASAYLINVKASICMQHCRLKTEKVCNFFAEMGIPATPETLNTVSQETAAISLAGNITQIETFSTYSGIQSHIGHENEAASTKVQETMQSHNVLHGETTLMPDVTDIKTETETDDETSIVESEENLDFQVHHETSEVKGSDLVDTSEAFTHTKSVPVMLIPVATKRPLYVLNLQGPKEFNLCDFRKSQIGNDIFGCNESKEQKNEETLSLEWEESSLRPMPASVIDTTYENHTDARSNTDSIASNHQHLVELLKTNHFRSRSQKERGLSAHSFRSSNRTSNMAMSVESARGATIYKRSRGGSYCCVVGCHCSSIKCFGLSFFSFPRPGVSKKQDEWRAALIHAIGRSDKSIPLSAKICSRHFEEECIKKGPSGKLSVLVPGSMPTRWMPEQSFKTSKTARPKPKVREPPIVPVRICYTSFMDMKKDLTHLPPQWIIMKNSEDDVVLGMLSSKTEEVHVKVSFSATTGLQANVSVFQMPAPWLARDIEMVRLKTFLKELGEKTLCTGVTETDLQPLAEIKITDEKYFRHITYVYENGKICSYSCVRATTCSLMVSTAETTCKDCLLVKKTLHERKNRQEAIKPNDPLRGRVIVVRNLNCRLLYPQKKAEARSNTHSFASNNKLSDVSSLKPNHFRKTVRRCGTKNFVINDKCAPFKCDECGARFALVKALNLHKKAHSHKSSLPIESEGQECSVESDRENEDIEKRDKAELMLKSIGFQVDEKTDSYQKEGDHSYSENCETWNRQTSRSEITPDKADLLLKSMVFHVDEKTDCCQKEGDHSYSENCETWNSQSEGSEIKHLPPFHQANHMRTHAQRRGIKMYVVNDLCAPFKCGECGARFALAKALTIHKKVHCNGFSNLIVKGDGQEHSVKNDETQREDAQKRDDETSKESDIKFQETAENINCHSIKQTDSSQKESCPPANDPCIAGDMQTSESEAMCDVFKSAQIEDQLAGSCEYCCAGERCEKCRATFSLSSSLEKHLKTHFVERRFPCLECSADFSKKKALKNHMARMHAKRKTFSCPECLVTLSTSHSLKNHIRIHTGEKPFQCEICKKLFRDCSALRKHYMRTHRTLSHVCQDCGKSFPFVYDLNQHRIIHTGQKTHTCQECKATFTYARNLALHMRIHTDERSFSCEICQKSFRQSSHLKAHLRTHSKERSFLCEDCGKTFASKDYLVVHYRTHTGERPHKCPSCPASYSQRGCLVHHMRIHTGEMFLCDICQKSFRSLQYLKKHKNIHSGEKFLCQDCGKTFFSKYRLKTHQKIHEGSSDNKHIHMSEQFISA